MFHYDHDKLSQIFFGLISTNVLAGAGEWLQSQVQPGTPLQRFNTAFVTAPRKTGKNLIFIDAQTASLIRSIRTDLVIHNWSADRLARVWLLMQLNTSPPELYHRNIENLFVAGEVNELVALYSSLPLLAYPEMWKARCSEGIRNNIGDVLTAIMCNNPYPSENLDESAWNQLVLKAFFTDKPMDQVIGLDKRANKKLAYTLSDYAHERWAAHRAVNPQLWRCVSSFIDEHLITDIKKVMSSSDAIEREAAALAAYNSSSEDARQLVPRTVAEKIESGELTWQSIAIKTTNYVLQ